MHDAHTLAKILTNVKNHLDDTDSSNLFQECMYLGSCVEKCFMSAMTVYRLRKISRLSEIPFTDNVKNLKMEITELIETLTRLVSWKCEICGKTVDAENKNQLELWIHAHKMNSDHRGNVLNLVA